jgi:hypothetical protein
MRNAHVRRPDEHWWTTCLGLAPGLPKLVARTATGLDGAQAAASAADPSAETLRIATTVHDFLSTQLADPSLKAGVLDGPARVAPQRDHRSDKTQLARPPLQGIAKAG